MSAESDSNPESSSEETTLDATQPEALRNIIKICKSYHFLDIESVHDLIHLKAALAHLSQELRNRTVENKLLYKFKDELMVENEKLKMAGDSDAFYRSKVNQLMAGNRDALLQLNQQQNQIIAMSTFLEEQRSKSSEQYFELVKQSQTMIKKLNEKIRRLEGEKSDLQTRLTDAQEKVEKLVDESCAMRRKCDEFLGEDAEKLSQIEGLQSRIESLLNDHQRIADQMADSNRKQELLIEELEKANSAQAQTLQSRNEEVAALNEKLTAQNTVVLYQKKLMQELTAAKNELTSKLARLDDELATKTKESTDSAHTLKSELDAKSKQLEQLLDENKQLQITIEQHELDLAKNTENSNRKLEDLQKELDAIGTQNSFNLTSLQLTLDTKQAELQATIDKLTKTDAANKAAMKKLQHRIETFEAKIREKDQRIADLTKTTDYAHTRFSSEESFNVVVPETESQTKPGENEQKKKISFSHLLPMSLNLPKQDEIDDDFAFVSNIAMDDDEDTDFEVSDGRSSIDEPAVKKLRSSYPPAIKESKPRGRKRKTKPKDDTDELNMSSVSENTENTSFNLSGISSLNTVSNLSFPKKMVTVPKPKKQ